MSRNMFFNSRSIAFCLVFFSLTLIADAQHWTYDDVQAWCNVSETCCKGKHQSPIDLTRSFPTTLYTTVDEFTFTNYDKKPKSVILENNGKQIVGEFADITPKPTVSGAGLSETYSLDYFRFAWGRNDKEGSEHSINGFHGPLELHLIHYNTKFANTSVAADSGEKDALLMISIIYSLSLWDNPTLTKITDKLKNVTYANEKVKAEGFAPKNFLPSCQSRFFKYYGSYTIPPCTEVVLHLIFEKTQYVSWAQMENFRTLYETEKGVEPKVPINHSFRPIQQLNDRTVAHIQERNNFCWVLPWS
uniref:carbonic anhydrase n=1 Tax=Strigamia maritima TaxID=126957 RepID=T1IHT1_STRMM